LSSRWQEALNTDSRHYGGSDVGNTGAVLQSEVLAADGHAHSLAVSLPPLSTVFLVPSS
jgi:1,4-alpha-glucan branching enzyme